MPTNGQVSLERSIPPLITLPRPLYARVESLNAGSSPARLAVAAAKTAADDEVAETIAKRLVPNRP